MTIMWSIWISTPLPRPKRQSIVPELSCYSFTGTVVVPCPHILCIAATAGLQRVVTSAIIRSTFIERSSYSCACQHWQSEYIPTPTPATTTVSGSPTTASCISGTFIVFSSEANADSSLELGMQFHSDGDGSVNGICYFKAASNNTGVHSGSLLWLQGLLLVTATFVSETSSGWQQVLFDSPVQNTAKKTCVVASYYTRNGYYYRDLDVFACW